MECIETRALKASFLSQMTMKGTNSRNDDVWCLNAAASEEFPFEDLLNLDFSDKDETSILNEDDTAEKEGVNKSSSSTFSDFESLSTGELPFPVEDEESLEWLSQFVEDSTAELSLLCPTGSFSGCRNRRESPPKIIQAKLFHTPVPRKPRNKRHRLNGLLWSLMSPSLSSVDSSSPSHDSSLPPAEKPPPKKPKRNPTIETGVPSGRRCTHCQVQKTPQWRSGPLGPKTLCNACGVRFKSGRLYPEYRPACSPTFLREIHSNSHRKVVEMRLKKEMSAVDAVSAQPVESIFVSDKF